MSTRPEGSRGDRWREFLGSLFAAARWKATCWVLSDHNRKSVGKAAEHDCLDREAVMREILRGTPYWAAGHLWLAQYALLTNRPTLAFASAQAAIALRPSKALYFNARLVLARCQLKAGDYSSAQRSLEELRAIDPDSFPVREDYAALLMYRGAWQAAMQELSTIPEQSLTGEGRAALEFARSKLKATEC